MKNGYRLYKLEDGTVVFDGWHDISKESAEKIKQAKVRIKLPSFSFRAIKVKDE